MLMNPSQMRASSVTQSDSLVLPPEGERKNLNSELWHACAGPLVSLPTVGSRVVYIPQGHIEQVAASTRKVIDTQIPAYPSLPPQLVCQLHDVTLHADMETDEVYCQMTLQPVVGQDRESFFSHDVSSQSRQPNVFFCKTLTASDTSTHGGFSIPRRAAEKVFPPLDFTQQPPAQELNARDLHDTEWKFRHIYRGQPKRHLLTTGWSVFVSAKRLVAGDSVLFIRNDKGQLLLGIRRAARPQTVMPSSVLSSDSMHIGVLAAAAHAANTNSRFTVFYNPRASPSEFVIPYSKFEKAIYHTRVSVGMRFRMLFETEESGMRRYMGTITGISDLDSVRWPNSQWRSIKVGWDESTAGDRQRRVSLWEIEPLTTFLVYPPTSNWRLRPSWPEAFGSPFSSDMDIESLKKPSMWMEFQNGSLGYHGLAATPTMGMNSVLGSFQRSSGVESAVYDALGAAALQEIFPSKQLLFQHQQQSVLPGGNQTQPQQQMQYAVLPQYQQLMMQQQQQQQPPLPLLPQQRLPLLQQQPQQQHPPPQQQSFHQTQQEQVPQHSHEQLFQKLHHQQPPQQQLLHQTDQQQPPQQAQLLYQSQHRPPQEQPPLLHQIEQHHHLSQQPPQQQQLTHQSHQQPGQQHPQQLAHQPSPPVQEQQQRELPYQQTSHSLNQQQLHVPQSLLPSVPQTHHQYHQQQQQTKQHEHQIHQQQAQHQRPNPPQPPLPITHSLSSPSFYSTVSVQQPQGNGLLLQQAQQQARTSQQLQAQQQQQLLSHCHVDQQSQPHVLGSEQLHQQQPYSVVNTGGAAHVPSSQPQVLLSNSVSPPHPTSTDSSSLSSSVTSSQHPTQSIFGGSAPDTTCSVHPNMASTAQSLMQPAAMAYSDLHQDAAVPASWMAAMSQLSSGVPLELMDYTRSAENTCDTDSVVLPSFRASGLPSNLGSYRISSQDDLQSDLQRQTLFGVNIDLQSMVMAPSIPLGGGMRSDDCGNDLHSQYMGQGQSPLPEIDLPLGSSMFNGGMDDPPLLQAVAQANPPVRTYTKVYKTGSVGRSIDVTRFSNYDELRCEIARLFGLEGQREHSQSGWQLIFVDKENDWLLLGDDPWELFINNVRYIRILSPSEVFQMQVGIGLPPVQRQMSSSSEDAVTQEDSRNPSSVITSLEY